MTEPAAVFELEPGVRRIVRFVNRLDRGRGELTFTRLVRSAAADERAAIGSLARALGSSRAGSTR